VTPHPSDLRALPPHLPPRHHLARFSGRHL